jgi:FAD/FMN-containing dehydrogenase
LNLSGWGNQPVVETRLERYRDPADAVTRVRAEPELVVRGNGRSYGDSAVSSACVLSALPSNRILQLDLGKGLIRCEAGLLLSDLLDALVPKGWFVPVTPGTCFVTIGGMVAADVHGKNHHVAGSFCKHVDELLMVDGHGDLISCSPFENADLFQATCGGMGLTGIILEVVFRLKRIETAAIVQETLPAPSLDAVMEQFEASAHWPYSVAWIDCLSKGQACGRSLLYVGRHAVTEDLPSQRSHPGLSYRNQGSALTLPFNLPAAALNRWSVRAFNALYYARGSMKTRSTLVGMNPFFYPLDGIQHWNRLYGRRGFTQYQCVLPLAESRKGLKRLLSLIAESGLGSFLAVLKLLGDKSSGLLSFPRAGYTLALDFPWNPRALSLLDELDRIVLEHGGRLYLAKDARMSPQMLEAGYPELARFRAVKRKWDPEDRFNSVQSRRLGL